MDVIGLVETHTAWHILLVRLLIAGFLGGIIGFERELHNRAAGLRTHVLVAVAAALFTLISFEIYYFVKGVADESSVDLLRVITAVTTGVAFLGAGTIFRSESRVRGVTTGAGMWLAGALGVAAACGYYLLAVFAMVMALIVLALLGEVEDRFSLGVHGKSDDDEEV